MTGKQTVDVAIVGGGMAGASLALLIAKQAPSLSVVLVEALALDGGGSNHPSLPSYDDRSSALSLGSCRIFQSLGMWEKLLPCLSMISQVHVSDRGHPAGTVMDATQMPVIDKTLGYVIENRQLGALLLDSIQQQPTITVVSPARARSVEILADGVQLELDHSNQSSLRARLLVIADGTDSSLREQLGIAIDRKPYGQCAVIANVTTSSFHQHVAYERFTDEGPMALLPLQDFSGEHRCALVWTIQESFANTVTHMDDATFLQNIQQRFGTRLGFFTRCGKRSIYPLALHTAREQVRQHVVLIGNAAHSMHPVAGQGFNLTLRDCQALAETLRSAVDRQQPIGDLAVLQHYVRLQQADQDRTIGASHLLTLLFSTAHMSPTLARNAGLFGLNFLPGLKQWFARHAMGIGGR